ASGQRRRLRPGPRLRERRAPPARARPRAPLHRLHRLRVLPGPCARAARGRAASTRAQARRVTTSGSFAASSTPPAEGPARTLRAGGARARGVNASARRGGSRRAVASTAGHFEAQEVEYCQRSCCKTGGPRIPARRTLTRRQRACPWSAQRSRSQDPYAGPTRGAAALVLIEVHIRCTLAPYVRCTAG